MNDFLKFRTFMTPMLIQVLFWIGVAGAIISGLVMMGSDSGGVVQGLLVILLGPVVVRIYAELLLIMFKLYEQVKEINQRQTP